MLRTTMILEAIALETTGPRNLRSLIRILINDEGGATAIEYSLIVAAIAGVIIVVVLAIGTKVQGLYQQADDGFPQP